MSHAVALAGSQRTSERTPLTIRPDQGGVAILLIDNCRTKSTAIRFEAQVIGNNRSSTLGFRELSTGSLVMT
jgi:hypothetical protein